MIDLSIIAAGGPVLLGAAVGLAARKGLSALEERRAAPQTPPKMSAPRPAPARIGAHR